MTAHEKTRLVTYRTSAAQYVNGRNTVHHCLLSVSAAADGSVPGLVTPAAVYVAAATPTTSSVSLGVLNSRRHPPSSLLRRLHLSASEGNDEPDLYLPLPPPPASTTMPSLPARPLSMTPLPLSAAAPPPRRPVLKRQSTSASTTTTVSGVGDWRLMTRSRPASCQSLTGDSSTLDALGLRRSVVLIFRLPNAVVTTTIRLRLDGHSMPVRLLIKCH